MHNANILLVDDSPTNLRVLVEALKATGFKTLVAASGEWALQQVERIQPDLILLDVMMPGIDGFETCRRLKANVATREIPVIFMTALTDTIDKVTGFAVGGVDYVTKPFQHEEVLARVNAHLTIRRIQQQLEGQNAALKGRTAELTTANLRLQQEITHRRQAETALVEHNRHLSVLNQMGIALQRCQTEAETYSIVAQAYQQLFPDTAGYVAILNPFQTTLTAAAFWGCAPPEEPVLDANKCWLVHRQKTERADEQAQAIIVCPHACFFQTDQHLCIPIRAAGKLLGTVSVSVAPGIAADTAEVVLPVSETLLMVVARVAESYALSLLNLRLHEMLRLESIHDPLTGLYNRRYMEEVLAREASRAARRQTSVGIIMLDIDHFKDVNDTHGHSAGDRVLRELGILLQRSIRREDIACRYGGEELVVIMPEVTLEDISKRAEELCLLVRTHPIPYQAQTLSITLSLGVALLPTHSLEIKDVLEAADAAMYQAKASGRNQVVVASA